METEDDPPPESEPNARVDDGLPSLVVNEHIATDRGITPIPIVADDEEQPPNPPREDLLLNKVFRDHFTLPVQSNTVRFRSGHTAARVFENGTSQFILEETLEPDRKIRVKQLNDATKSLQFLRFVKALICALWTGLLFVFCLQVLLTMVLELSAQAGETSHGEAFNLWKVLGVVLSLVWFCKGFAAAMVISTAFIADNWAAHFLMKKIFFTRRFTEVFIDWLFFAFFLLIPILVFCGSLLAGSDSWWSIASFVWVISVGAFYVVFAIGTVYFEISGALSFVIQNHDVDKNSIWNVLKKCVLLKQQNNYSGKRRVKYVAQAEYRAENNHHNGTTDDGITNTTTELEDIFEGSREEKIRPWTRFTQLSFFSADSPGGLSIFKKQNPPKRLHTIDDILDFRPFVTKNTWGLERLYCRPRNSRYITVVDGPGALTLDQMRSSIACAFIAVSLWLLMLISLLSWLDFGTYVILVAVALFLVVAYPSIKDNLRLIKIMNHVLTQVSQDDAKRKSAAMTVTRSFTESEVCSTPNRAVYLVVEYDRVTRVTDRFCYAMMALELSAFIVYPAITLFTIDNTFIGLLFLLVSTVTALRHYIHLVTIIEETGSMNINRGVTPEERWANKSRLNGVIQAISYDKSRFVWLSIMGGFGLFVVGLLVGAYGSTTDPDLTDELTFFPQSEYYYPPQSADVRYPTCNLPSDLFGDNATLVDFAFMSKLAYHSDEAMAVELPAWFGDEVVAEGEVVDEWRNSNGYAGSPVFFRLFRYNQTDTAVVAVRGTSNAWDLLADSQLWSTAMLMQGLRSLLPVGEMWTPILDELVWLINSLQGESLDRVSFYKVTTAFVDDLKNDDSYKQIKITGHSLGGGIAIITGAQSGVPAVAVSGPNARISGSSFEPKVTHEQLDRYTFNVIPARDPVARFDDVASQFQNIRCNAGTNRFMDCHTGGRSLCELMYTCGSRNRPIPCLCYTTYGFEAPTPYANARPVDEICPATT